jgi:hypothetical protein
MRRARSNKKQQQLIRLPRRFPGETSPGSAVGESTLLLWIRH